MTSIAEPSSAIAITLALGLVGFVAYFLISKKKPKPQVSSPTSSSPTSPSSPTFLNKQRQKVQLIEKNQISPDTAIFRFALSSKDTVLGLPVGKHFKIYCPNRKGLKMGEWNGKPDEESALAEIERKYTPISSDDDRGYFDLLIKLYKGGMVDRFPDGGKMSQHFHELKVGDFITLTGPWGIIEYKGRGHFKVGSRDIKASKVGMMAGGTGITPMLQVINAILKDDKDTTHLSLIFANQTEDDILVRNELETLRKAHSDRFLLHYTLDRPNEGWTYSSGFITKDMIQEYMPPPSDDTLILMCGPPPMVQFACQKNLNDLGYTKEMQAVF